MKRTTKAIVILMTIAMIIAACGSEESDDTTTTEAATTATTAGGGNSATTTEAETATTAAAGPADISVGKVGTPADFIDIADVCGDEPVTVGVIDGIGTNSWSRTVLAEIESEASGCASISGDIEYAAGLFDLQATTSAITGMAARGIDVILVIPDAGPGEAHLPAMRTASEAGSIVVPFASDPTSEAGDGYLDYVDWSPTAVGRAWAQWTVDQLGSEGGDIVFLGGPAGNAVSTQHFDGILEVLGDNPQVNLLVEEPVVTNWDPAQAQEVMAGLLSQFEIDAIIIDYGTAAGGVLRAYESAGQALPPIATTDDNALSCGFEALKADNPQYELATASSRTWAGRIALRKGLAAFYGIDTPEPSIFELGLFEDSTGATDGTIAPAEACLPDAPPDATPSSLLTPEELSALFSN